MSQQETAPATIREEGRAPCRICGGSMEGEHHRARDHKACKSPGRSRSTSGAIKIRSVPDEFEDEGERREYFLGTVPDFPIYNVTAGGHCFPRFSGCPVFDPNGKVESGSCQNGGVASLTDAEVDRIVRGVENRVVRWIGKAPKRRAQLLVRDGPYRLQPGDEPLAKYLYMIPVDGLGFRGRDEIPETMLEE